MATLADLARPLNLRCRRRLHGRRPPALVLLSDQQRLPDPLPLAARLPAGSLVILRHYDDPERRQLGLSLARLCRAKRLTLLVAGDFALAQSLRAGLHLPEYLLKTPQPAVRLWVRRSGALLTAACHGRSALASASAFGVGAALLSPVFPTASHPGAAGLGLWRFRALVRQSRLPVFALGGVSIATARQLAGSAAAGLAAIGGFL